MSYYDDMCTAIDAVHAAGSTVNLISTPGEGKTSFVNRTLAQRSHDSFGTPISGKVVTLLVSTMEGPDLAGALMVDKVILQLHDPETGEVTEEADVTRNATPSWAVEVFNSEGITYTFLDEVNLGSADTLGPLQSIIQDKAMPNGFKFGPNNRFICAMNPRESINNGTELSTALTNRMTHLDFAVPFDDWLLGFMNGFGKSMQPGEVDLRAKYAMYLRSHREVLNWKPDSDMTRGWSSKRSWDNLVTIHALAPTLTMLDSVIVGTVGPAHAASLRSFLDGVVLPSPDEVWADITVLDDLDSALMFAVLNSCALYAIEHNDPERLANILTYTASTVADQVAAIITTHINALNKTTDSKGNPGLGCLISAASAHPALASAMSAMRNAQR